MSDCVHLELEARVEVNRLFEHDEHAGMPDGFSAEIRLWCRACDEPFVFFADGLPVGLVRDRPAINPDATELRCPVRPQSSDPLLGLGLAGFSARLERGGGHSGN